MTLRNSVYEEVKKAMKAREAQRLETLRFIWSNIKNVEIDAKHELTDEEVVKLLMTEVKRRKEAIEQFRQGKRDDLAEAEEEKLKVIQEFLPEMMSEEEIAKVVDEVVAAGVNNFGAVMGQVMGRVKGKAEGNLVSKVVKEKLG